MFARSIRLESQFHILMETLEDGVVGVNERGEVFACNRHAEEITRTSADLVMGKPASQVFPYLPFSKCLQERERLPAKIIRLNGINVSAEVVPVMRQRACIGAFAILQRFNDVEARQSQLRNQLLHKGYRAKYGFEDVIGESDAIQKAKEVLRRMAVSESPILLIGETGTGKELFAHAVHRASRRRNGPFVAINVAAFPENLLESELFGYEEGAFTGAKKGGRLGLLEISHQGTLFLDEVEGMSPALQVKLLRVLQEREIMRVGGTSIIPIDVRIVAATNESPGRTGRWRAPPAGTLLPVQHPAASSSCPCRSGGRSVPDPGAVPKGAGRAFRLTEQVRASEILTPGWQYPGVMERSGILPSIPTTIHHHGGPAPTLLFHRRPLPLIRPRRRGDARSPSSDAVPLALNSCIRPQRPGRPSAEQVAAKARESLSPLPSRKSEAFSPKWRSRTGPRSRGGGRPADAGGSGKPIKNWSNLIFRSTNKIHLKANLRKPVPKYGSGGFVR